MHLLSILTLFDSLATAIPLSASPYKNPDTCPAPPANPGVFFCLGHNFKGNCFHQPYTNKGWCGNFPDFESRPRSIGPDLGGYCIFFNKIGDGSDLWLVISLANDKKVCDSFGYLSQIKGYYMFPFLLLYSPYNGFKDFRIFIQPASAFLSIRQYF